jgi:hypothetical protein
MEYLLDNPRTEQVFKQIIRSIPSMQNGLVAESMEKRGMHYEKNWGVSVVDLKVFAGNFEKDHLLALKLWNKKWRETMILATLLDDPKEVSEEQMDFWVKTTENIEIIEQAAMNLFPLVPYAFAKALEWCHGKKYIVKFAGLMLMGRLALVSKSAIDEMFEPFFEILLPLSKDNYLSTPLFRSVCQVARRSNYLLSCIRNFIDDLQNSGNETAISLGHQLIKEFNPDNCHPE